MDKADRVFRQPTIENREIITHPVTGFTWAWFEKTLDERVIRQEDPDKCWDWKGAMHRQGYGMIGVVRSDKKSGMMTIQRLSLGKKLGRPLLDNEYVISSCINPKCCNPKHLTVGDEEARFNNLFRRFHKDRSVTYDHKFITENANFIMSSSPPLIAEKFGLTQRQAANLKGMIKIKIASGRLVLK